MSAIIEIQHLNYKIKDISILEDISFSINKGDYTAVIGPNGGGKTTLVNTILGLNKNYNGEIKLFNTPLNQFKNWDKIGYVPQRAIEIDNKFPATVFEIIKLGRLKHLKKFWKSHKKDYEIIERILEEFKITDLKNRLIGELSGGQKQRVMIAKALVSEPQLLVLDEPNTGVDVESQKDFYKILQTLNRDKKLTIVFITHDIGVIEDSITSLITINKTAMKSNNARNIFNCQVLREVYGVDSHLINH